MVLYKCRNYSRYNWKVIILATQDFAEKKKTEQSKSEKQTYARITAPVHIVSNSFKMHENVEGYFENRNVPNFKKCDRLVKIDSLFGTIQMGYNPKKGKSFIFANIKTSIFDTAASRYKKEFNENNEFKNIKNESQNATYSSARKQDSATIIYNSQAKPWSESSIAPYIYRKDTSAFQKTMPFLTNLQDIRQRSTLVKLDLELKSKASKAMQSKDAHTELIAIRQQQHELLRNAEFANAMIVRKNAASRQFFKTINYNLDIQKHEMFEYYREQIPKSGSSSTLEFDETPNEDNKNKDTTT